MKTMLRCLLAMAMMLAPLATQAREDELTEILDKCLRREMVSPDSIEYNLRLLEQAREGQTGVRRAVYTACLAQLYAMRAYSDVTGQWRRRSVELFREALADPESLHATPTSEWIPLVKRGKDEKLYGSDMLHVLWNAADSWAHDSVMTRQQLLDFYAAHGNSKPQETVDKINRLQAANDTIWKYAPRMVLRMAEVYYPGDSLHMLVDTANVTRMEWKVRDARGRLLGVNVLTAPVQPGRYTLEARAWTDVRLNKPTRVAKAQFVVSRLQAFVTNMPGRKQRVTVTDARTGRPIPEARTFIDKETRRARVTLEADSCLPEIYVYNHYNYNAPARNYNPRVAIYTDRAIYRPGQQIQLSAVLYEQKHWDARVRAGQECRVQLLDRKRNVLADTTVTSDDFGVVAATLTIPAGVELGGNMLSVGGTVQGVRIEEYKRPTFYVELDKRDKNSKIMPLSTISATVETDSLARDTLVSVTGRAMNYDGTPLRGGRVIAMTHRICCWWWRGGRGQGDARHVDTVYTDMEGRFAVRIPVSRTSVYRYFPMLSVEVSVLSAQGETQTDATLLRLFEEPPMEQAKVKKKNWCECPVDTFDAEKPARLEFRNQPGEQRYVFLTAFAGDNTVMDTMMLLLDTLTVMDIPYETRYGDGLRVLATHVLDGKVSTVNLQLRKRLPEKTLSFHWDTFRDYTRPGATEEWTLRVNDAKGRPVRANIMMGMYDTSLDAFGQHRWSLLIWREHHIPYTYTISHDGYRRHGNSLWYNFDVWTHKVVYPQLSYLNPDYFRYEFRGSSQRGANMRLGSVRKYAGATQTLDMANTMMRKEAMAVPELAPADGEVMLEEAVVGTAGSSEDDALFDAVQVRSDFSETALFMPRLRTDDEGRVQVSFTMPQSLTTWTLNALAHTVDLSTGMTTEKIVARKVLATKVYVPRFVRERDRLSFTVSVNNTGDAPQSGKMQVQIMDAATGKVLMKKKVAFRVDENRDTVYTFSMPVAEGLQGLTFKAVAMSSTDSDGEQREIPVLASVANLTEGKALTLQPGEETEFKVSELFPKGATDRRVIVEKILDPVQTAIDALPEVAQPKNEDVLSYAAAYYAADKLGSADTTLFVNKLLSMQKTDGGMPWFDGFGSSPYLTREVGYLLARLNNNNPVAAKVMAGIKRYLLTDLKESIERRKKYDKDWTTDLSDMRTLYVLVKDGRANKEMLSMVKTMLKRMPDDLQQMDSEYLAIAMIVKHALKEAVLKDGVKVLNTRLQHSDGVYLAYRGGNWTSIDRRLHIHTQVMEAWQTVCPQDTLSMRGMQQWLLRQKRTQGWKTPVDCIDAVFALTGGNVTRHASDLPTIQRDTLDLNRTGKFTVANPRKQMIWAAVYAEYALPIEQVQDAGMDIRLERTFSAKAPQVGDRITEEVLIDATRDYEYLVLSIPRSAATEPVQKFSGYGWQGVGYYMQVRDDRTDYFIPSLPHGKYIIRTEFSVERDGSYSTGIPTIKCCYAEEFRAHGTNKRQEVAVPRK